MIEGKNIILRPLREGDLEEFFRLKESLRLYEEYFQENLGSEYRFRQKFFRTGFWEENEGYGLILENRDRIVGYLHYKKHLFDDALELAFFIFSRKDRGKGLMSEALSLFSAYLFATKRIHRLQLSIPDYNRAAITLAQKCGFVFEGIARQALFSKGKYVDLCRYSMLREECKDIEAL